MYLPMHASLASSALTWLSQIKEDKVILYICRGNIPNPFPSFTEFQLIIPDPLYPENRSHDDIFSHTLTIYLFASGQTQ